MATAQDYTNKTATLRLTQTVTTNEIPFTQGGWQGGTRTPDEFNTIIHNIYTKTIAKWREEGIGYHIKRKGMQPHHMGRQHHPNRKQLPRNATHARRSHRKHTRRKNHVERM